MFRLIRQVSIALLSFSRSLATKCASLNTKSCMTMPTHVDLNPVQLNYYLFMVVQMNVIKIVMLLRAWLQKYVFRVKKKDVNVKSFNDSKNR